MLNNLKNWFIPSDGNNFRPVFLRKKSTKRIIISILCIELIFFVAPRFFIDFQPASVILGMLGDLTNKERQINELPTLKVNPTLSEAASLKAEDMVKNNYFAHTSPGGKTPWSWLDQVGYRYDYAGENLAVNFSETQDVTNAWMNSPTHRANIVKSAYTEMGSGMATGTYKGRESIFVVQIYANPRAYEIEKPKIIVSETQQKEVVSLNSSSTGNKSGQVLGATAEEGSLTTTKEASFIDKLFASPRQSTNTILIILLAFVIIALLLNIFIKFGIQFGDMITNGLLIITVIISVCLLNLYFGKKNVAISSGIDYSISQTI